MEPSYLCGFDFGVTDTPGHRNYSHAPCGHCGGLGVVTPDSRAPCGHCSGLGGGHWTDQNQGCVTSLEL